MSGMKRITGHILTPQGFRRGVIEHENGRIVRIDGDAASEPQVRHEAEHIVLPGFIDQHVHGGGGRDIMEGGEAANRIARIKNQVCDDALNLVSVRQHGRDGLQFASQLHVGHAVDGVQCLRDELVQICFYRCEIDTASKLAEPSNHFVDSFGRIANRAECILAKSRVIEVHR